MQLTFTKVYEIVWTIQNSTNLVRLASERARNGDVVAIAVNSPTVSVTLHVGSSLEI